MKSWMIYTMACVLALGSSIAFAAPKKEDKKDKPKATPEEVFKKLDKDGNGKVSLDEFVGKKDGEKKTKAEATFKAKDKNNDGALDLDEFKAGGKKGDKKGDKKPDANKAKKAKKNK